jgi:hypothetical protein
MVGEAKVFADMNVSWRCKKYEKMHIKYTEQKKLWEEYVFSQKIRSPATKTLWGIATI